MTLDMAWILFVCLLKMWTTLCITLVPTQGQLPADGVSGGCCLAVSGLSLCLLPLSQPQRRAPLCKPHNNPQTRASQVTRLVFTLVQVLRTALVHNKQLAKLSRQLGFDSYIMTSKTEVLTYE